MAIRVVLAEDNYLVREGVAPSCSSGGRDRGRRPCADYDELMAAVAEHEPDVVLTDIRMPPTGTDEGIRAASELARVPPGSAWSCCPSTPSPTYALALLESGSEGRAYLLKERVSDPDQLRRRDPRRRPGRLGRRPEGGRGPRRRRARRPPLAARPPDAPGARGAGRDRPGQEQRRHRRGAGAVDRAVEKHINSLFAKLGLSEEPDIHRRVKAVLLYLAEKRGVAPPRRRGAHPGRGTARRLWSMRAKDRDG